MKTIRASRGFTIVEIMIVLAAGGLILLIVFQAIPSLQRGSRNSQRKQDIQTVLESVSHYELNDSGKFPDDCGDSSIPGQPSCSAPEPGAPNDYFMRFTADKLTLYTQDYQVLSEYLPAATPGQQYTTNVNLVVIHNHMKCTSNGRGWSKGAGYNDIVALYALESGSGATGISQCEQL